MAYNLSRKSFATADAFLRISVNVWLELLRLVLVVVPVQRLVRTKQSCQKMTIPDAGPGQEPERCHSAFPGTTAD